MTSGEVVLPMIVGTAVLTFGIRYLPIALLGGRRLRPMLERFLRHLPIGVLSALVAQSTFLQGGILTAGMSDYYFHGLIAVLLLAAWTRSMAAVVFGGLALVGLLTLLGNGTT